MATAAISPSALLAELDSLWVSMSKDQTEQPDAILRACSMTLIVATEGEDGDIGETLAKLMRDHPSRLIVLRIGDDGSAPLAARVVAQCWRPFGWRQQICCEQIEISASHGQLQDVPPVLRGLLVPDLPVALWLRGAIASSVASLEPILPLAEKVIVDSQPIQDLQGQYERIEELRKAGHYVGDVSWTRLTTWRQSIAQIFDDPSCLERISDVQGVRIQYQGSFVPMSALYLVGWLNHSLGRELDLTLVPAGECTRARVHSVALLGTQVDYSVTVAQDRSAESHGGGPDAHSRFPTLGEYELLREELSVLGPDPVYEAVLKMMPQVLARYSS
ncbi:MAG: glucose-6-phosphate dehydrogenase assembly protein OpcA [Bryobacteraceae bacterium]